MPVLVLTDSYNTDDLEKATELGAKEYITKPFEHHLRIQLLRELNQRWLSGTPAPDPAPKPLRTLLDDLLPPVDDARN